ncbi:uncharacterized protein N0V89_002885 [Didymosphaeria variabile]|uniref:Aquaporin-like protein n=1 Tax=Didymosphaeria variabile TaxID=1932322 RepID=A0A9W8XUB4_9PLEO|nr:uncharacterized protein N0V89_002885 [Didymosphaeria variabile]KAJ4358303.1 hypothetical protein N0V89_002885 [Didymosphaeria variabile]
MAHEQSGSLPQYYGQTIDGTVVESPKFPLGSQSSRDALLRLPIQPNAAHVNHPDQELMSPVNAMPNSPNMMGMGPASGGGGSRSRAKTVGDSSRWMVPHKTTLMKMTDFAHIAVPHGDALGRHLHMVVFLARRDGTPPNKIRVAVWMEDIRATSMAMKATRPPRRDSTPAIDFVAFVGEFVGTTMFLFFAFSGTQVANVHSEGSSNTTTGADTGFSPQVLQYISLVFGFSLMVNVWIFFRISGGLFNPAVTFAMLLTKAMSPIRFFLLLVAQLAGSIFSSYLVSVMFPTPLNVRTTLSANTSLARGVFIEAVLTAELVFTIFMLAKEKHKATFIAPVGIGLALFVAELVGVYYTGGSLNPARSFGPCVVTGIFDREHWIYWVGPAAGAVLAVVFYNFIKILEYEMANPDQDADDKDVKEKQNSD